MYNSDEVLTKRLYTLEKEIHDILQIKNPGHAVRIRFEHLCRERADVNNRLGYNFNQINQNGTHNS